MLDLVPYEPSHIRSFSSYGGQERLIQSASDADLEALAKAGPAWTGMSNGAVVGCAGFVRLNEWRAQAWAALQKTNPASFILIHNAVKRTLDESEFQRVETYVNPLHPAAMRWVKMLGFRMELAYIPYFFPNGGGASFWAWSKQK